MLCIHLEAAPTLRGWQPSTLQVGRAGAVVMQVRSEEGQLMT